MLLVGFMLLDRLGWARWPKINHGDQSTEVSSWLTHPVVIFYITSSTFRSRNFQFMTSAATIAANDNPFIVKTWYWNFHNYKKSAWKCPKVEISKCPQCSDFASTKILWQRFKMEFFCLRKIFFNSILATWVTDIIRNAFWEKIQITKVVANRPNNKIPGLEKKFYRPSKFPPLGERGFSEYRVAPTKIVSFKWRTEYSSSEFSENF